MPLKRCKRLLLASSLLLLASCKSGPMVPVCSSYPEEGGFRCIDEHQKSFFIKYEDSKGMVALKTEWLAAIIDYWRSVCGN